jgi:iron complex outermembrane receptor protein
MRRSALALALAAAAPLLHAQVLEEIVVTAQKRSENVMDVPIALTAYSGEALKDLGTRSISDIGRFTAGVDMNNDKSLQPTYAVRGVETNDWTIGSDPAVAVYIDGVYAARGAGAEAAFIDVERVEILKGPQGTLFGRNATGGAIHIITHKPSMETEGHVKATGGNYQRRDIEGLYNMPLSDTLAARVMLSMQNRDGYIRNLTGRDVNDVDKRNVRASLLWDATDNTEVVVRGAYEDMHQNSGVLATLNSAVFEAANPNHSYDTFGDAAWDAPEQVEDRELASASIEVNHELEDMTFTSITGWRHVKTELLEDLDGSNNPEFLFGSSNPERSEFFSQELRLTGNTDRLKWTAGATYTNEKLDHDTRADFNVSTFESFALPPVFAQIGGLLPGVPAITPEDIPAFRASARTGTNATLNYLSSLGLTQAFFGGLDCRGANCDGLAAAFFVSSLPGVTASRREIFDSLVPRIAAGYGAPWVEEVESEGDYSSWAGYGDATWSITDETNLTGGIRYTYDDKQFDLFTAYQNYLILPGDSVTDPDGFLYGLAFNSDGQPVVDASQSESWGSWSGRIVLDHHFTDEIMAYASVSTGFKSGGFNSLNYGPGIASSYDAEEVINYEMGTKGTLLEGKLQYSSALFFYEYENLQSLDLFGTPIPSYNLRNADAEGYGFELEGAWAIGERVLLAGNYSWLKTEYTEFEINPAEGETAADDLTGEPRAESPEHKFAVSAQYTQPLAEHGDVVARIDYTWGDDRIDPTRGPVSDYGIANARIAWYSADSHWEVALWSTNLADEEQIVTYGNGQVVNSTPGWRITPRMYGVDLQYNL